MRIGDVFNDLINVFESIAAPVARAIGRHSQQPGLLSIKYPSRSGYSRFEDTSEERADEMSGGIHHPAGMAYRSTVTSLVGSIKMTWLGGGAKGEPPILIIKNFPTDAETTLVIHTAKSGFAKIEGKLTNVTRVLDNLRTHGLIEVNTEKTLNIVMNGISKISVKGRKSDVPGAMYPVAQVASGIFNRPVEAFEPHPGRPYDTANIISGKSQLILGHGTHVAGKKNSVLYPIFVRYYDARGYSAKFPAPWER